LTGTPPSASMRASLEAATGRYVSQLTEEAMTYLTVERGLSKETVEYFRLGLVADPLVEHEAYRNRISIPYITPSGVVSLRFRSLPGGKDPKYLGMAGLSAKKLFNTTDLYTTEVVYICEGEFDAMIAHQMGLKAVGVAGVNNWEKNWWRVFRNRTVVVLADNDDKGQGQGMAEEISSTVHDCTIVMMPSGHDVTSAFNTYGPDSILQLIEKRMNNV